MEIPNETIQALQTRLRSLGYNRLPGQVSADRIRFESARAEPLEVVLRSLDLDKARSVSLNQREFDYTLRPDLWIFLVLTMGDMEPMLYLVPSMVFDTPNNVFVTNNLPPAMHHFSTWEIKVFTRGIAELSRYALDAASGLPGLNAAALKKWTKCSVKKCPLFERRRSRSEFGHFRGAQFIFSEALQP